MKTVEKQITFLDQIWLPVYGFRSLRDTQTCISTLHLDEARMEKLNQLLPQLKKHFVVKPFNFHKTDNRIQTPTQALSVLTKCLDLLELPYQWGTCKHDGKTIKYVRLKSENFFQDKIIENKMSEIRPAESHCAIAEEHLSYADLQKMVVSSHQREYQMDLKLGERPVRMGDGKYEFFHHIIQSLKITVDRECGYRLTHGIVLNSGQLQPLTEIEICPPDVMLIPYGFTPYYLELDGSTPPHRKYPVHVTLKLTYLIFSPRDEDRIYQSCKFIIQEMEKSKLIIEHSHPEQSSQRRQFEDIVYTGKRIVSDLHGWKVINCTGIELLGIYREPHETTPNVDRTCMMMLAMMGEDPVDMTFATTECRLNPSEMGMYTFQGHTHVRYQFKETCDLVSGLVLVSQTPISAQLEIPGLLVPIQSLPLRCVSQTPYVYTIDNCYINLIAARCTMIGLDIMDVIQSPIELIYNQYECDTIIRHILLKKPIFLTGEQLARGTEICSE